MGVGEEGSQQGLLDVEQLNKTGTKTSKQHRKDFKKKKPKE